MKKISKAVYAKGVDVGYLLTGISGVFLGLEFPKSVFLWVLVTATVFCLGGGGGEGKSINGVC